VLADAAALPTVAYYPNTMKPYRTTTGIHELARQQLLIAGLAGIALRRQQYNAALFLIRMWQEYDRRIKELS
jgi:hypothetical protein